MKTLSACPICKSNTFTPFLTCKDYTVSQQNFTIVSCKSCSFKFTNPRPEDEILGDYYKSEDYISHSNTSKGIISKLYKSVRNYTLKKKLKLNQSKRLIARRDQRSRLGRRLLGLKTQTRKLFLKTSCEGKQSSTPQNLVTLSQPSHLKSHSTTLLLLQTTTRWV